MYFSLGDISFGFYWGISYYSCGKCKLIYICHVWLICKSTKLNMMFKPEVWGVKVWGWEGKQVIFNKIIILVLMLDSNFCQIKGIVIKVTGVIFYCISFYLQIWEVVLILFVKLGKRLSLHSTKKVIYLI